MGHGNTDRNPDLLTDTGIRARPEIANGCGDGTFFTFKNVPGA